MENTRYNIGDVVYSIMPERQFQISEGVIIDSNIPYKVQYVDFIEPMSMFPSDVYPTLDIAKEKQQKFLQKEIETQTKVAEMFQYNVNELEKICAKDTSELNEHQKIGLMYGLNTVVGEQLNNYKKSLEHTNKYIKRLKQIKNGKYEIEY